MKNRFLNNYMNVVVKNNPNLSDEQLEKMRYGIEGIYLTITKLVIIVTLGILLGIIKELLILLLFYNILRFFGFGYHAKGSNECLVFSILLFVVLPYLAIKNIIIFKYKFIVIAFCMFNFLLFAPSDTKKRPMINKKKRIKRKIFLLLSTLIFSILILLYDNQITLLLLLSIIIESFMVNPMIYWLTKEPYNNYKTYNPN